MTAPTLDIDRSRSVHDNGERTFIAACQSGLCNRLRVLVSGIALAEATGRRFTMWWPRSSACAATFPELFENDEWDVREVPIEQVTSLPKVAGVIGTRVPDFTGSQDRDLVVYTPEWLAQPKLYPEHAPLMKRSVELFGQLRPAPVVRERVDRFRREHFRPTMIGVHLRRGDFNRHHPECVDNTGAAMLRVDAFLQQAPDAGILLCSDDGATDPNLVHGGVPVKENVRAAFTARYGDRVVATTPRSLNRGCPEAIQDALADLMLLRRTDFFVGTRYSTFSDTAVLGRGVPSVNVVSDSFRHRATEFLMRATFIDRAVARLGHARFGKPVTHWSLYRYYRRNPRHFTRDATLLLARDLPVSLLERLRRSAPNDRPASGQHAPDGPV